MTDEEIKRLVATLRGDLFTWVIILMVLLVAGIIIVTIAANNIAVILCAQHPVEICKGR